MARKKPNHDEALRRNAIIVCFQSKHQGAIHQGQMSIVFRKQGPTGFVPEWMYAHINAPVSAVTARMRVLDYRTVDLDDAAALTGESLISEVELRNYASPVHGKEYNELVCYKVADVQIAKSPVSNQQMRESWSYWPSSTFYPLGTEATTMLDSCGGFS